MIVYQNDKNGFLNDVLTNSISDLIHNAYFEHLGRYTSNSEVLSWRNSMMYMNTILCDEGIPKDSKISIEFQIPLTSKRIDFIITGQDEKRDDQVVIIELKQWETADLTEKDAIVRTQFQHGKAETAHPSYQAWSYAYTIANFNSSIEEENITLHPCAYLHNYKSDNVIDNPFYQSHITKAPLFLKSDALKLRAFIKKYIKFGDEKDVLYKIENGRLRPSKQLSDSIAAMLVENKQEFIMLDDQKVVFESALVMAKKGKLGQKHVLIIEGGPGTGKSVVAINLLVELTKQGLVSKYISKNVAPRAVYEAKLTGRKTKSEISNLFGGSGAFIDSEENTFDCLIVDEAHRLNYKSGLYQNLGDNQIQEIIHASKCSVFFVDDNQQIHIKDIGSKSMIESIARQNSAKINHLKLQSQFRCNGSDGYLAWLDNVLQIRNTANIQLSQEEFDFRIFDDPNELRNAINEKNRLNNKSRLVAGYCWDWKSKKDKAQNDIIIPEFQFEMKWNLQEDGSTWIIGEDSINEIGCIHTCQGLELDYVGVIIGNDLGYTDGKVTTNVAERSKNDRSILGIKKLIKENKTEGLKTAEKIIKNTYRTLFSRGMKGCYVYFCDQKLSEYFRANLKLQEKQTSSIDIKKDVLRIEYNVNDDVKYEDYLPLYSIKAACGAFGEWQDVEEEGWVKVEGVGRLNKSMYVVRATGHSMEPKISDGDFCVFRANVIGSRINKIVLVQHNNFYDSENQGSYSIKKYTSEKKIDVDTGEWQHQKIVLQPLNKNYENIIIEEEDGFNVVGELIKVLK